MPPPINNHPHVQASFGSYKIQSKLESLSSFPLCMAGAAASRIQNMRDEPVMDLGSDGFSYYLTRSLFENTPVLVVCSRWINVLKVVHLI
uniref:Uncharacterized protein n=1 Tax=Pyxicephalus adspersus TaxID=30357 RepID=A0AAV3AS47_PYXAD|nr:TPA: hypothetical protein GDO54_009566 [Pyxicephalus adspersus]